MATGPNQGNDPIAFGLWAFPDLFSVGDTTYVMFNPDGSITGVNETVAGLWNTDHNGLNQPPAAIFVKLTQVVNDSAKTIAGRFNFSATPIAAEDDGKSTLTTYAPNTDTMTLNPTVKKIRTGINAFQLYSNTE